MTIKSKYQNATSGQISEDRIRLQNPYAHLCDHGNYEALSVRQPFYLELNIARKKNYKLNDIQTIAHSLHRQIWQNQSKIYVSATPVNPIDLINPELILKAIGYKVEEDETLGLTEIGDEVAGTINQRDKIVHISKRFPPEVRNFTLAHELGHALLHQTHGLHRDKPLDGKSISNRDLTELEADKFASQFLLPENLLRRTFNKFYLTDKFILDDNTAFALLQKDLRSARSRFKDRRSLSRHLANNTHYNLKQFKSLAEQFNVSVEAMAIRLEEIGCV